MTMEGPQIVTNKIIFLQTGGTIDKDYPHTTKGWAFEFGKEPAIQRILDKLDPSFEYEIVTVCKKDSLEITDRDRECMVQRILDAGFSSSCFVVTHGTDTMMDTAAYLHRRLEAETSKTIAASSAAILPRFVVITGAMRPERFTNSDAPMNVGSAIGTIQLLQEQQKQKEQQKTPDTTTTSSNNNNNVFIAMHGVVKPFDTIQRDMTTGKYF